MEKKMETIGIIGFYWRRAHVEESLRIQDVDGLGVGV